MGESKRGEGRAAGPTSDSIVAAHLAGYVSEGREVESVVVKRAMEDLYSVEVKLWGEKDEEEIFYFKRHEVDAFLSHTPLTGISAGKREG
jgi:hypothetical protein